MANEVRRFRLLSASLGCLIIGASLGWLIGLSASPVTQGVLTAILAMVATLVAGLAGLGDRAAGAMPLPPISPWPLVALVLGMALLAPAGIAARERLWIFAPRDAQVLPASADTSRKPGIFALYSGVAVEACEQIRASDASTIRVGFVTAQDQLLRVIGRHVESPETLLQIGAELCKR